MKLFSVDMRLPVHSVHVETSSVVKCDVNAAVEICSESPYVRYTTLIDYAV